MTDLKIQRLNERLEEQSHSLGFKNQTSDQKIKELEKELQEQQEKFEGLLKSNQSLISQNKLLEGVNKDMQEDLDNKYEHFEEMNKYINELLKNKKFNLSQIESNKIRISELEFDIEKIINDEGVKNLIKTEKLSDNTVRRIYEVRQNPGVYKTKKITKTIKKTIIDEDGTKYEEYADGN